MYSRRMANFLLGAWIGASLLMAFVEIENYRSPSLVLSRPVLPAAKLMDGLGQQNAQLLLRHFAAEQIRHYSSIWEEFQIGVAVILGGLLLAGTTKRMFPLLVCGVMLALVLFEHFALTPELAYQGRAADFPPGSAAIGSVARVWALQQMYAGAEIVKLLAGGVLASFLFAYHATRRRSSHSADSLDYLMRGPVNRGLGQ